MATKQEPMKDVVHSITMTDDHTLRLITNLATLDYTIDSVDDIEKQLDKHKYEDNLVLEPDDLHSPSISTIISYFMKKGYSDNRTITLTKRSVE